MIELLSLKKLSTHHRYILLSLVPTLLLSTVLGFSFLWLRLSDLNKSQLDQGFSTLNNFSYLVQISLNGAPEESIQDIAYYILNNSAARSVNIFNSSRSLVATAGPVMSEPLSKDRPLLDQAHYEKTRDSIRFYTPLREDLLSPVSTLTKKQAQIKNWGWIEIEIPAYATTVKRYQAFTLVMIVVLISWLLHLAIVLQRAHLIDMILNKFSQAFSSLKSGNFKTSMRVTSPGDLGLLEAEFNSMCYALQQHQEELYRSMQQTNDDINETLETIEIQNIELDLARKEALKASQSKSDFLAKMSHEIRTPLNGIIGFTHLLSKSNLTPRQYEQAVIIQKSANGLLALINDILDFSKIEAGKLEIDQVSFNLQESIEEVLDMLAPFAEEKKLELISLYYSDTPSQMVGDPLRIKQIITNLINNAIKFSNQGNVLVRTMLESENDSAYLIKISITDNGQGLSKKDQELLFQSFSQLHNGMGNAHHGTGLGLVISKHLTELMGGNIGCISESNQGATFWFTFQVRKDPMGEQAVGTTVFNDKRIALYEKNVSSRLALSQQLQQLDIYFDEFDVLDDLTAYIRSAISNDTPYHAVIMGLSFSEEADPIIPITIENIEKALNCRVIVLSHAYAQNTLQHLLDKSASVVLGKPAGHAQLLSALQGFLKRGSNVYPEQGRTSPQQRFTKPPRILAVDDTATNLQLLCIFLRQLGAHVTACESGKEAIQHLEESEFDLIFMDYRMPDMNGLQATQIIRAKEANDKHIPIIGLTAHAAKQEKLQLLAAGMDDCITKPVDEKQLYQIIVKWTGNKRLALAPKPDDNTLLPKEAPVVDTKECLRLVGGKADLAKDMFNKFIDSLHRDKARIVEQQHNTEQLLETVHGLHGASRYCGVPYLRTQVESLEKLIHRSPHKHREIAAEVDILLAEIERVLVWAQQHPMPPFEE